MGIPFRATRGGMFGNTSFVSVVALETRGFVKGIGEINKALEKHVRKARTVFQKVSGIVSVGANTTVKALTGITVTLGGIATAASVYGARLERFMRVTSAIVSQTGGNMLDIERRLTDAAREMARTTDYSVTEIARSMTRLAQAGLNTEEIIQGTRSAIELAGITMGNLEFTTRLMAATFRQFGMKSMKDMARIADVFTVAITKSLLSLQDLEYAMKYAGPVAASLGWSIEEAAAAVAQFANLGLTGSLVGTHLRMSMGALLTVAGKTQSQIDQLGISSKKLIEAFKMSGVTISAQQRVLRRLGLTINDVNPMLHNLGEILQKLADAGMTAQDAYILFTRRAGGDIAKMVEDIKRTGRNAFNDFLEMLKHAGGRAHKIYTQTLDTVSGQWRIFVNIIKDVGLEIFYAYKDELKSLLIRLSEAGSIVRKALADPEVKAEIRRIFVLVTSWIGKFIKKLTKSKDMLFEFIVVLQTILKIVKYILFFVGKLLHVIWTDVRKVKVWSLNFIASIADASGRFFNTVYNWFVRIRDFINIHFLQGNIYDTFKKVVEFIKHPVKTFSTIIKEQKLEAGAGVDPSKVLVGGLTNYKHPIGIKLIDFAKKLREEAEFTSYFVEAAIDTMAEEFYDLDKTIENMGDKARITTKKTTNLIEDEVVSTIKNIKDKVKKIKKEVEKENEEYADNFLNKQKKTSEETISFWKDAWRALKSYTKTMFDTFRDLGESGGSFFDKLVSYMPEWKKIFVDTIDSIHASFKNTLIGMMEGTKSFKDFWIDTWNLIKRKTIEIIAELMTQWVFNTFFGEILDKLGLLETSGSGLFYKLFHPDKEEDKAKEVAKEVATTLTGKVFQGKLVSEAGGGGILSGLGLGSVIDSIKKGVKGVKTFVGKLFGFGRGTWEEAVSADKWIEDILFGGTEIAPKATVEKGFFGKLFSKFSWKGLSGLKDILLPGLTTVGISLLAGDKKTAIGSGIGTVLGSFFGMPWLGGTLGGLVSGLFKNKNPDKYLWAEQIRKYVGANPVNWGSGEDWALWFMEKFGVDRPTADHYGALVRQKKITPEEAIAELSGQVPRGTFSNRGKVNVSEKYSLSSIRKGKNTVVYPGKIVGGMPIGYNPRIPLQRGGFIAHTTTAILHPGEIVLPINRLPDIVRRLTPTHKNTVPIEEGRFSTVSRISASKSMNIGKNIVVEINISNSIIGTDKLDRIVRDSISKALRREQHLYKGVGSRD